MVLVVDDDEPMRRLCRTALEPEYRVVLAENGRAGPRAPYAHRPDLVLLDVAMPVLDGWETWRRIRELTATPIVVLTARAAAHAVARGLDVDAGAADYVVKPVGPIARLARIRAVLRRRARPAAPPAASSSTRPAAGQRFVATFRNRIETANATLTGRFHLEAHLARTFWGLLTRGAAKIAASPFAKLWPLHLIPV